MVVAVEVMVVSAVDVADVVAVDVWVEVAVTVLVAVDVPVDVTVLVAVDVPVDVCVSVHASHPTGHSVSILTPKSTVEQAYEGSNFAQLSGSNLPLHNPCVVPVVVCEVVIVDVAVDVTVVKQLSVAAMIFLVRFCLTIVLSANATVLQVAVLVCINVCQLSTAASSPSVVKRRLAIDTLDAVLTRNV